MAIFDETITVLNYAECWPAERHVLGRFDLFQAWSFVNPESYQYIKL